MDKKRRLAGIVILGIGLSLMALGIYMRIVMTSTMIYGPLMSMKILMWFAIVSGAALLTAGGIRIKKSRESE